MKVIFLDIDGVLNSLSGLIERGGQTLMGIFHEHEKVLDWVLRLTDAKVIISSSWRIGTPLDEFKYSVFSYKSIGKAVIGVTPRIPDASRGEEIQKCILEHQGSIKRFVILDDDSDMGSLFGHLVQTDNNYGLTAVEGLKTITKLMGEEFVQKNVWCQD